MDGRRLYGVKMRASLGGVHISGAERIVPILVTEDIIYLFQVIHIHIADDRRTVSGRC